MIQQRNVTSRGGVRTARHRWWISFTGLCATLIGLVSISEADGRLLQAPLERGIASGDARQLARAEAIVLVGGRRARAEAAARLREVLRVPVLVTGKGTGDWPYTAESERMAQVLQVRYGFRPEWIETASVTTRENAAFSHCILQGQRLHRIVLVTDAWHMLRAGLWFRRSGFDVVPFPVAEAKGPLKLADFVPSKEGIRRARIALHEFGGIALYAVSAGLHSPACPPTRELVEPGT
jgi:uncharacterized SAM-binding protein YcdF (DUF218 family)